MYRALPGADYYADSATPSTHQPASGLAGRPPAAQRVRGASHVHHDPFDRVGSWLYPYSASGEHSQSPASHHARVDKPCVERAAVNQGGIVAVDDPCPPGFGSFLKSRGFYHQFASLCLSVSLARARASGSAARPSHRRGRFTPQRAIPRPGGPPASPGRCIGPDPASQPARMRCRSSVISFRMAPRGAASTSKESTTPRSSTPSTPAARRSFRSAPPCDSDRPAIRGATCRAFRKSPAVRTLSGEPYRVWLAPSPLRRFAISARAFVARLTAASIPRSPIESFGGIAPSWRAMLLVS
jgi:hypothetical protein